MTHTNQTVDSIETGIRFHFAAAGESYLVASGVIVRSTDNFAIVSQFAGNKVQVNGLVDSVSALAVYFGNPGGELIVGKQGIVSTTSTDPTLAAVFLTGGTSTVTNLGRVVAESSTGILAGGSNNDIVNSGLVKAASGAVINTLGAPGDSLENFGRISASSVGDEASDYRFNNGVFAEGANAFIANHAKGVISAISSEGAGVAITGSGNGSEVVNEGRITSKLWYGVDFFNMNAASIAHLENSGTISGGSGSFRGNDTADFIVNTGTMKGDVIFNAGDDVLDGGKGKIVGKVFGGDGNDILRAGKGNQRIDGGANDDIIDGGKGKDVLHGGAGLDTFVFSTGYGKDEIEDFAGGTDLINLSGWKAIKDFDDMLSHAKKHGSDLWITADKDVLVLDNVAKGDLHEASFIF